MTGTSRFRQTVNWFLITWVNQIAHFLKLHRLSKGVHMSQNQVSNEYLSLLEHRYKWLTKERKSLESEIRDLRIQPMCLRNIGDSESTQMRNKT